MILAQSITLVPLKWGTVDFLFEGPWKFCKSRALHQQVFFVPMFNWEGCASRTGESLFHLGTVDPRALEADLLAVDQLE